jgi:hypothetical protein
METNIGNKEIEVDTLKMSSEFEEITKPIMSQLREYYEKYESILKLDQIKLAKFSVIGGDSYNYGFMIPLRNRNTVITIPQNPCEKQDN